MNPRRRESTIQCLTPLAIAVVLVASRAGDAQPQQAAPAAAQSASTPGAKKPPVDVKFADGMLQFPASGSWKKVRPRSRIVEHEFAVPAKKQGDPAGRLTVTRSGGGVEGNIDRWQSQFLNHKVTTDGKKAKIEKKEVAGMPLHVVDITGTFLDSPRGPFGPKTERPDYRMLGAILETRGAGLYFFKFVGPAELVKRNAKAFDAMLKGIKATAG